MKELIRDIATRLGQFLARFATRSRFGRVLLQSVGDGIEHLVLKGGTEILKSVKSVLVEVDDRFLEQDYACREILSAAAGMFMKEKAHSQLIESGKFSSLYNQIWVRT